MATPADAPTLAEPKGGVAPGEARARTRDTRITELDALRGVAAFGVIFHHLITRFYEDYGRPPGSPPPFPIDGMHGVFLFFVISGFVISKTLHATTRGRNFVLSRFSRIYPAFWVCATLTYVIVGAFGLPGREVTLSEALVNLTMLQDHFDVAKIDYVYWSLTLELSFYLLAYVAHALGWLERHPYRLAWCWLAYSAVVVLAARRAGFELPLTIRLLTFPEFAPLFMAGIMFFRLHGGHRGLAPHLIVAASFVLHNFFNWHGYKGIAISMAICACFYLLVLGRLGFLRTRVLLFLGAISYPLYLLHDNIGMVGIRLLLGRGVPYNVALPIAVVLVMLLAAFVTFVVERPAMRWLRARFGTKKPKPS